MTVSLDVAVIGAGISGLLAARELLRENHRVTVFERSDQLGGTWVYDHRVEGDHGCLGLDINRTIVHSSLYSSLRTNLPRPLMSFSDYSLEDKSYGDPRLFPGHEEVLKFIQDFAKEFRVIEAIRFNSEVVAVDSRDGAFVVKWRTMEAGSVPVEGGFDAVVVCSGHYTEPRFADDVPGIEEWSRKQVHSHNYRIPEPYQDQIVVIIGSGPSATDISREISTTAREVHLSSRSSKVKISKLDGYKNIWQYMKIKRVSDDGIVMFEDGDSIMADVILHCTGYKFHFPFLEENNLVRVDDNRVGPLYKHVFVPELAPRLAFIGIPYQNGFVFRLIELQAKWVALALSGTILLPSKDEMLADIYNRYRELEDNGTPKRYTHSLNFQFDYVDWLASQLGFQVEDWHKKNIMNLLKLFKAGRDDYRDMFVLESQ